jgi:hypothetical protein
MTTVDKRYEQKATCNVPTQWGGRLYFGPCKIPMRPKMDVRDLIIGISPRVTSPRRILFIAEIENVMTFADAFAAYPALRGPSGPIHVRPRKGSGSFPDSAYEHIPGSIHQKKWRNDLASPRLDRFFAGTRPSGWRNLWLGANGPEVDKTIVSLLNQWPVFGKSLNGQSNNSGTIQYPIAHGRFYSGLHVEVRDPTALLSDCAEKMRGVGRILPKTTPRLRLAATACSCGA